MMSDTQTAATKFPIVLPTRTTAPTARVVLRNSEGEVVQQWLLRQNKCTLGSSQSCTLRCEAPGIAPYHALIVVGARQTFVRALSPKLTRDAEAVNEILITDDQCHFEIAGHRFELTREPTAPEMTDADSKPALERMKFTLARPLELKSRSAATSNSGEAIPAEEVAQLQAMDSKWVARLVQSAIEPLECQLLNVLEPISRLQEEAQKQRELQNVLLEQQRAQTATPSFPPELEQLLASQNHSEFEGQLEALAARQSAAMDVIGERINDVNNQLSAIERIVADDQEQRASQGGAHSENQAESSAATIETAGAIEQLQSGMVSVSNAIQDMEARQQAARQEDATWKGQIQDQVGGLRESIDLLAARTQESISQLVEKSNANAPTDESSADDLAWKADIQNQFDQLRNAIERVVDPQTPLAEATDQPESASDHASPDHQAYAHDGVRTEVFNDPADEPEVWEMPSAFVRPSPPTERYSTQGLLTESYAPGGNGFDRQEEAADLEFASETEDSSGSENVEAATETPANAESPYDVNVFGSSELADAELESPAFRDDIDNTLDGNAESAPIIESDIESEADSLDQLSTEQEQEFETGLANDDFAPEESLSTEVGFGDGQQVLGDDAASPQEFDSTPELSGLEAADSTLPATFGDLSGTPSESTSLNDNLEYQASEPAQDSPLQPMSPETPSSELEVESTGSLPSWWTSDDDAGRGGQPATSDPEVAELDTSLPGAFAPDTFAADTGVPKTASEAANNANIDSPMKEDSFAEAHDEFPTLADSSDSQVLSDNLSENDIDLDSTEAQLESPIASELLAAFSSESEETGEPAAETVAEPEPSAEVEEEEFFGLAQMVSSENVVEEPAEEAEQFFETGVTATDLNETGSNALEANELNAIVSEVAVVAEQDASVPSLADEVADEVAEDATADGMQAEALFPGEARSDFDDEPKSLLSQFEVSESEFAETNLVSGDVDVEPETSSPSDAFDPRADVEETSEAALQEVDALQPESADDSDEEGSVEDYMKQLLARMRGGAVEEATQTAPAANPPAAPQTNSSKEIEEAQEGQQHRTADVQSNESEPKVEADFGASVESKAADVAPRITPPERTQNLAAMRELANSSARTAIHKSTRKRHFTTLLIKASIAFIGLVVGIVLIGINGLSLNIGLVATIAALTVAAIWGYDSFNSLKPLLQAGLVLKPAADSPDEPAAPVAPLPTPIAPARIDDIAPPREVDEV